MRSPILIALAAIAVSACNGDQGAQNRGASEQNVTSQVVATNDTTAIDAATGEAADMAADVDFMPELDNATGGNAASKSPARRRTSAVATDRPRTTPAEPRASNAQDDDESDTNTL